MRWITQAPIVRRLFLAAMLVAVIPGVILWLLGHAYIDALTSRSEAVQVSTDAVHVATTQLANLQHMHADLIALQAQTFVSTTIAGAPSTDLAALRQRLSSEIKALEANFAQGITSYQRNYQLVTSPQMSPIRSLLESESSTRGFASDQQQTLQRIVSGEWERYRQAQDRELAALQSSSATSRTTQLLQQANSAYTPLENDWKHIVDLTETMGDKVVEVTAPQVTQTAIEIALAAILIAAVVLLVGTFIYWTIARPLGQLARLTRRIARGDTSVRAPVTGRDEIALVARSLNAMLDHMVRLIQEIQEQRNALQKQIEALVSDVSGVSQANLSGRARMTGGTLQIIANAFNYMLAELSSLVMRVKGAAREVAISTTVVVDALARLVETGDQQLQQIARATREIEHIAASSRHIADRANMLQASTHESLQHVHQGRQAVQQVLEGLKRIYENVQATAAKVEKLDEHSRAINSTAEVISAIVEQTNRLAQDAATLVAYEGDTVRGFGAVAADIQRLAERANGQARSIVQIVEGVRQDISAVTSSMRTTEQESASGAERAQEAGAALETISAAVELQAREIERITDMAARQLQAFTSIVQIMQRLSQATRQMNVSTRQASQHVETLAQRVEYLRRSVEVFRLREGSTA
ncbi:methyl-accepting chemotaxis protein [Thermogemmatispora sp.]|uniref:methyl-accepting chemotaxis protein n=1 Tax=Thermogemmatispora sp. TaxID=1968838 RepID=UPI0026174C38|nr:methyl-accepting chemotaxis protein [Thermogemmatispora sp.]